MISIFPRRATPREDKNDRFATYAVVVSHEQILYIANGLLFTLFISVLGFGCWLFVRHEIIIWFEGGVVVSHIQTTESESEIIQGLWSFFFVVMPTRKIVFRWSNECCVVTSLFVFRSMDYLPIWVYSESWKFSWHDAVYPKETSPSWPCGTF